MGQQQLLLIILGVFIIGIAIVLGVTMFEDNAVSSDRDAVQADLAEIASKAQAYYRKTAEFGGGGNSFASLTADSVGMALLVSSSFSDNTNGTYTIKTAGTATTVVLHGIGKTSIDATNFPEYDCTVTATGYTFTKIK